jgi:hypothetical protein
LDRHRKIHQNPGNGSSERKSRSSVSQSQQQQNIQHSHQSQQQQQQNLLQTVAVTSTAHSSSQSSPLNPATIQLIPLSLGAVAAAPQFRQQLANAGQQWMTHQALANVVAAASSSGLTINMSSLSGSNGNTISALNGPVTPSPPPTSMN